jgi:hypothetical protein
VLCAGSTLPLAKQSLDEAPYKLSGAVAKLAGITFARLSPSYWIDYLGFITEGKLAAIFSKPSLGVSNWLVIFTSSTNANKFSGTIITAPSTSFLAPLPGKKKTSARGVSHAHPLLCFSFALLYFCLHHFIKNKKKLVPPIVVIFVGLLLSCFIMLSINGWFL